MAVRDITIGQYFPADSPLHRLDARTKILGTVLYIVSLFCAHSFSALAAAAVMFAVCAALSRVPFGFMSRGLRPVLVIIAFTMVLNAAFTAGGAVLVTLGPVRITSGGVRRAVFMAVRLVLMIFGSSLLTLTTKPLALTDGLEKLFSPFSKLGLPAHELAMMMGIALRFIPTLMEETDKIMKAQTARGASFGTGGPISRAKSLLPLLVPLFVSAFRIASDLAMAMESRCYRGGEGRTRMNAASLGRRDLAAAVILAAYMAVVLMINGSPLA
jgi:energy-coupling factor transport system permease protein